MRGRIIQARRGKEWVMIDGRWLRVPIQTNRPPLLERKGREPEDVKRLAYDEPPPAEVYPEPTPEQVAAATARPVRRGQPFVEVVCVLCGRGREGHDEGHEAMWARERVE